MNTMANGRRRIIPLDNSERTLYAALTLLLALLATTGIIADGYSEVWKSLLLLQFHGARLINDFTVVGSGAAVVNATLVAAIGLLLVGLSEVRLSGPTIAAVFTMLGFGLFGKTPLNCIPIIAGVWLAAKTAGKTLGAYSLIALFGTALGPLVTFVMFETDLSLPFSIPLGIVGGMAVGFMLPSVASSMLQLHQGYNLYNIGFTCGFIGLFASNLLRAADKMEPLTIIWNQEPTLLLVVFVPVLSLFLLVVAGIETKKKPVENLAVACRRLQSLSGRLPSDFFDAEAPGAALCNMALLGLASWVYVMVTGAPCNGPVIGGMLTVIGFGGFGKTLRNTWPVVAGVLLATLVFGKSPTAPGPVLAALFGTTLAPIAGQFGVVAGIAAGFLHLVMVESTASWHGGLDLYNNGFAGGLTATLVMAIVQWFKTNRPREDFD